MSDATITRTHPDGRVETVTADVILTTVQCDAAARRLKKNAYTNDFRNSRVDYYRTLDRESKRRLRARRKEVRSDG